LDDRRDEQPPRLSHLGRFGEAAPPERAARDDEQRAYDHVEVVAQRRVTNVDAIERELQGSKCST